MPPAKGCPPQGGKPESRLRRHAVRAVLPGSDAGKALLRGDGIRSLPLFGAGICRDGRAVFLPEMIARPAARAGCPALPALERRGGKKGESMAGGGSIASIRRFCLECQGDSPKGVRECADTLCPLWQWRMAAAQPGMRELWCGPDAPRRAMREIRRQCLACAGGRREVRQCAAREACPLWRWRFGVHPRTYRNVRQRFFAPRSLSLFD